MEILRRTTRRTTTQVNQPGQLDTYYVIDIAEQAGNAVARVADAVDATAAVATTMRADNNLYILLYIIIYKVYNDLLKTTDNGQISALCLHDFNCSI